MRIALFIARRVAYAIGLLLAVAILNFTLIHLAPGDGHDRKDGVPQRVLEYHLVFREALGARGADVV